MHWKKVGSAGNVKRVGYYSFSGLCRNRDSSVATESSGSMSRQISIAIESSSSMLR